MYQNEIENLPQLQSQNFENIFQVYTDQDDFYFYNLLQTIHFPQNLPDVFFKIHYVTYNETWPVISYKYYNTTKLWWVIALANNIINPINSITPGDPIKIPNPSIVSEILTQIALNKQL